MARGAALTLALGSAVATWIWPATGIGAVGIGAALWAMFLPLRKPLRVGLLLLVCASYLGSNAVRMHALADEVPPWDTMWWRHSRALEDYTLPLASIAEFDFRRRWSCVITLDWDGQVVHRGVPRSLAELEKILAEHHDDPVLLRIDRDTPFRHLAWVLGVARAVGYDGVFVAAKKHVDSDYTADQAKLLGGRYAKHGGVPDGWFPLSLAAPRQGRPLRIIARKAEARLYGPDDHKQRITMPTVAKYELGGRRTYSLSELAEWLRATPPDSIDPGPKVPVKFVVAAINVITEAKVTVPGLVRPEPPDEETRRAVFLRYPQR